jgi:hypothetical protein
MMPGDPGLGTPEITVTRFTAPQAGVFSITGASTLCRTVYARRIAKDEDTFHEINLNSK